MRMLVLCCFVLFTGLIDAQPNVTSEIKAVTVYLSGAEVTRVANVNLREGLNEIVLNNISHAMRPESINVQLPEGVTLLAINEKLNHVDQSKLNRDIEAINNRLDTLRWQLQETEMTLERLGKEKAILESNSTTTSNDSGLSMNTLREFMAYYRLEVKQINKDLTKAKKNENEQLYEIVNLEAQLEELNWDPKIRKSTVTVQVKATRPINDKIIIRYVVTGCGWAPDYDIVVKDVNESLNLRYRAKVANGSGVDWKQVPLKLSTADAMRDFSKPELRKWRLSHNDIISRPTLEGATRVVKKKSAKLKSSSTINSYNWGNLSSSTDVSNLPSFGSITINQLMAEFTILEKYDIPSDGQPYLVEVEEHRVASSFNHFSAPSIKNGAYLLAGITGWESLRLISGEANIYFNQTYIGRTSISTATTKDTLELSIGVDDKIAIERTELGKVTETMFFGNTSKKTEGFKVKVKNNRNTAINIEIQDQIPVSEDDDVKVELEESSKAQLDDISGILRWNLSLAPGESKSIEFVYSVRYPKGRSINTRQMITVPGIRF